MSWSGEEMVDETPIDECGPETTAQNFKTCVRMRVEGKGKLEIDSRKHQMLLQDEWWFYFLGTQAECEKAMMQLGTAAEKEKKEKQDAAT